MKPARSQFPPSIVPSGSGSVQRNSGYNQGQDVIIDTSGELSADYSLEGKPPATWSSALRNYQEADLPRSSVSKTPPAPKKRAKKKR